MHARLGHMNQGKYTSSGTGRYRWGWNDGSEKDNEIKGAGNSYSTFFREVDTRLGVLWGIDPKSNEMPWMSPYVSMENNPLVYNDPFGDKVKNGVTNKVEEKKKAKARAEDAFNKMVSEHPGEIKKKTLRKYRKESGLKDAENNLKFWQEKEKRVDEMIETFKKVMPKEFEFLDTKLFDSKGNTVDVEINFYNKLSPKGAKNPAYTNLYVEAFAVVDGPTGNIIGEEWSGNIMNNNTIEISLFSNGLTISILSNEFGDIDYLFKYVKPGDSKSYFRLSTTGNSNYPGYWNDPGGAGQMSFKYQDNFKAAFKKYSKTVPIETVDAINWIIH